MAETTRKNYEFLLAQSFLFRRNFVTRLIATLPICRSICIE